MFGQTAAAEFLGISRGRLRRLADLHPFYGPATRGTPLPDGSAADRCWHYPVDKLRLILAVLRGVISQSDAWEKWQVLEVVLDTLDRPQRSLRTQRREDVE